MNEIKNNKLRNQQGLTLMELVIASALLISIVALAAFFAQDLASFRGIFRESLTVQQEIQQTLGTIVPEIRSMGPSNTGSYAILTADRNTFTFYSDIDKDGLFERIRYFLDDTTLKRGVIVPSGVPLSYNPANEVVKDVVHDIVTGTDIFSYFDESYTGEENPLPFPINIVDVRIVKVRVTADQGGGTGSGPITLETQATMRNLRSNL